MINYREIIDALYGPLPAVTTTYAAENASGASLVDLRQVDDPSQLGQYFTITAPDWAVQAVQTGAVPSPCPLDYEVGNELRKKRPKNPETGQPAEGDTAWGVNRFMVVEIDYLLFKKDDAANGWVDDRAKALQAEAVAFALQASGFPFTLLVHSGSKSIHAFIRFDDDDQAVMALRDKRTGTMKKLVNALTYAMGDVDVNVLRESGRGRLVRTPGAIRDNGQPQQVIAIGTGQKVQTIFDWAYGQLDPVFSRELQQQPPLADAHLKFRKEQLPRYFHKTLLEYRDQGERGATWRNLAYDIACSGAKAPTLIERPSGSNYWGSWSASFLWWVGAYVFNQMTSGWFFTHDDNLWNENERCRWPEPDEVRLKQEENYPFHAPANVREQGAQAIEEWRNRQIERAEREMKADITRSQRGQHRDGERPPEARGPGRPRGAGRNGQPVFDPQVVGDAVIANNPTFRICTEPNSTKPYCYEFNGRYWERHNDVRICLDKKVYEVVGFDAPANQVGNCVRSIRVRPEINTEEPLPDMKQCVLFQNGTLYIEDGEWDFLENHFDLGDYCRYMLPYDYDMDDRSTAFSTFLEQCLPDVQTRMLLQEFMGYCLMPYNPLNKFLMNQGESAANGKSTFNEVMGSVFGDLHTSVSLQGMAGRFHLAGKEWKLLMTDDEVSNTRLRSSEGDVGSILKAATGNAKVQTEIKGGALQTVRLIGKFMFNCNQAPAWATTTDNGFWRRLIVIPWNVSFEGREDVNLAEKLKKDKAAIFSWALRGLHRLRVENNGHFTVSEESQKALKLFKHETDPVAMFLEQYTTEINTDHAQNNTWMMLKNLKDAYDAWGESEMGTAHIRMQLHNFAKRVSSFGIEVGRPYVDQIDYFPLGYTQVHPPARGRFTFCVKNIVCTHPDFSGFGPNDRPLPLGDEPIRGPGYVEPSPPGAPPSA